MIKLHELLDEELLHRRASEGYVSRKVHETEPLAILNYTAAAQYDRVWDDVTRACRGLIHHLDSGEVVARPFPKFFNLGEDHHDGPLPATRPDMVLDKLDGSLGIVYPTSEGPAVSTRGSFHSEQARWATRWLRRMHPDWTPPDGVTVLGEIIYPGNRIVVDYGDRAEVVGLSALRIVDGVDTPIEEVWPGAVATELRFAPGNDGVAAMPILERIARAADQGTNNEGFVLAWRRPDQPALRIKVKSEEYMRLHRIITGTSNRTVWAHLADGRPLDELAQVVPDEFHDWLRDVADKLTAEVAAITMLVGRETGQALLDAGEDADRRAIAEQVKTKTYPGLCFAQIDGKADKLATGIWRMVKPERDVPFLNHDHDTE